MNPRLLQYLRSIGLDANATDEQAWEFFQARRGLQSSIACALNYNQADDAARTNCDLMIRAIGYDPANPNTLLAVDKPPVPGSDGTSLGGDLEKRLLAQGAESERKRRAEITQYAAIAGCTDDFVRGLLDDPQITSDVARDKIFEDHKARTRADVSPDMPTAPAGHSRSSVTGISVDILEAAMLHRSGIDPTKHWVRSDAGGNLFQRRATAIELEKAADLSWELRGMSMEDILRRAAVIDKVTLPAGREGLMVAYARSFSTAALSAIYTTNMNSQLLAAFEVAPDSTTGGWVREADVPNFKTNERARMVNGGALKKLPRGSAADHATFEDVVETYKIARYAKQFVVDDQDIQDDTFGAMNEFTPADFGVAARQLRPDLIYSLIIANAAMRDSVALFHATHANLSTTAALGTAGKLEAARKAMRIQTENGRNLNPMAKFLIVPPALEDTADVMVNSRLLITGESATKPENNPNYGKGLVVVTDARLENGVVDPTDGTGATVRAGSATTWYLAAMASAHTIEVGYLRGAGRRPQIRSFVLTEGRWGIGWDIKMDIGAKALDWRGWHKATA